MKCQKIVDFGGATQKGMLPSNSLGKTTHLYKIPVRAFGARAPCTERFRAKSTSGRPKRRSRANLTPFGRPKRRSRGNLALFQGQLGAIRPPETPFQCQLGIIWALGTLIFLRMASVLSKSHSQGQLGAKSDQDAFPSLTWSRSRVNLSPSGLPK